MSALAAFLMARGARVTGSDRDWDGARNIRTFETLSRAGISLVPQNGQFLASEFDRVVFSTAVEDANPDSKRCMELGVQRVTRPELLSELVSANRSIAVAGTSGKSTTSGWLAYVMNELGLSPSFLGGARIRQFRSDDRLGNMLAGSSDILVAEACESDKTIVQFRPDVSVLLNISKDHHDIPESIQLFEQLCKNTRTRVILNGDDGHLKGFPGQNRLLFGTLPQAHVRAVNVTLEPFASSFDVQGVSFRIQLPGMHNVYNALAVITVLLSLGTEATKIVAPLSAFQGVERRFEIHLNRLGRLVVDDYAHNPDKISALMKTMIRITPSTCYVFQPHGYGPTRFMRDGYVETFKAHLRKDDRLFILPIFYAGGTVVSDISSQDLVSPLRDAGYPVELLHRRADLFDRLGSFPSVAVFGARDESLSVFASEIASRLSAT